MPVKKLPLPCCDSSDSGDPGAVGVSVGEGIAGSDDVTSSTVFVLRDSCCEEVVLLAEVLTGVESCVLEFAVDEDREDASLLEK
jgi:hypothetical protein